MINCLIAELRTTIAPYRRGVHEMATAAHYVARINIVWGYRREYDRSPRWQYQSADYTNRRAELMLCQRNILHVCIYVSAYNRFINIHDIHTNDIYVCILN